MCVLDDRFVAKELSKAELQTMETFAPAYFDYMSSAVAANVSVFLAPAMDVALTSSPTSDLLYSPKFSVVIN